MQPNELYEQMSHFFIERYDELIARHDLAKIVGHVAGKPRKRTTAKQ